MNYTNNDTDSPQIRRIKKDFILSIALSNSHSAAFQRANVYSKDSSQIDRDRFIEIFREKLKLLETKYPEVISEEEHIDNIKQFCEDLSARFQHVLANKTLRFGIAQKAVNLYVKFLWVFGYIQQPPHCPVDRIVLNAVEIYDINWTQLDDVGKYIEIIEVIRKAAENNKQTIAEWELTRWNDAVTTA